MNENERSHRGDRAKELLENELLQETIDRLDQTYVTAWRAAKTPEAREDLHRYVQLTGQFISDLKSVLKDGQLADHRIKELEGKPAKRFWG